MRRIITAREQVQMLAAWRKIAAPTKFNYALDPHEPHGWQEHPLWDDDEINSDVNRRQNIIPRAQHGVMTHDWHPSIGETHVRYDIQPEFHDSIRGEPTSWRAMHYGPYQGHHPVKFDDDDEPQMWPKYHRNHDDFVVKSDDGESFPTADHAILAASEHFDKTYRNGKHKPDADYYDKIMNNLPDLDDDFGDIFGGKP